MSTYSVTRGLALYTGITEYDVSYSSPWNAAQDCVLVNFYNAAHLHTIPQNLE